MHITFIHTCNSLHPVLSSGLNQMRCGLPTVVVRVTGARLRATGVKNLSFHAEVELIFSYFQFHGWFYDGKLMGEEMFRKEFGRDFNCAH